MENCVSVRRLHPGYEALWFKLFEEGWVSRRAVSVQADVGVGVTAYWSPIALVLQWPATGALHLRPGGLEDGCAQSRQAT